MKFSLSVIMLVGALLSACTSTARHAVGTERGQQMISHEHRRMWDESFTDAQWHALLQWHEHRPGTIWHGVRTGSIQHDRSGIGFSGLSFRDSRSHVLEQQLSRRDLLVERPLLFVPLFDHEDVDVVLAAVYPYRNHLPDSDRLAESDARRIADAFRGKLLGHRDVRVRWAAMLTLGENRWLTAEDIRRGLDDETDVIRVLTCFWSNAYIRERNEQFLYDDDGDLVRGDRRELSAMVRDAIALAPILLDHVNDTHFHVRSTTASAFRALFRHWIDRGEGRRSTIMSPDLPEKIDWTRADWQTRHDTQEIWKQ